MRRQGLAFLRPCVQGAWCECAIREARALPEHVRKVCPELAYLQDVCTESKHAEITRYPPRIDAARLHPGDFSSEDFCSEDFDTSRLEIVLREGRRLSFSAVIERAVEFWSDFMDAHGSD